MKNQQIKKQTWKTDRNLETSKISWDGQILREVLAQEEQYGGQMRVSGNGLFRIKGIERN